MKKQSVDGQASRRMQGRRLPPATQALALEPRLLFDGAAADAAVDILADAAAFAWSAPQAPAADAPSVLLVVDTSIAGHEGLLRQLPANVTLRLVQQDESGIAAIGAALSAAGAARFDAIHVLGHGQAGTVYLGRDVLTLDTLPLHAPALDTWRAGLTDSADILLYGCDLASSAAGIELLGALAQLTGADVAASTNTTGALELGGDWLLEAQTGAIEATLPLTEAALAGFSQVLAATAVTDAGSATPRVTSEDTELAISGVQVTAAAGTDSITLRIVTQGGTSNLTLGTGVTLASGALGSGTFAIAGTVADINANLDALRFTPELNKNSSTAAYTPRVDFSVTAGGAGSASITNISVTAVNDAPSLATQVARALNEGAAASMSLAQLASSNASLDPDIGTGQQQIDQLMLVIDSLPTKGTLTYQGGAVATGVVVPVIQLGSLVYTHDGTDLVAVTSDSFNVRVNDGGGGQTSGSISLQINPVNKAPTVSGSPALLEGQVKVVAPTITFGDDFDTLDNASIVIDQVNNGGQGTLFFDANDNAQVDDGEALSGSRTLTSSEAQGIATRLKFRQDGTEPNLPAGVSNPSYRISVTDGGGGTGVTATVTQTITLTVAPNNDDPTLTNAHATELQALAVDERVLGTGPVTLTSAMLLAADADRDPADTSRTVASDQLVYSIVARPTQGELQLNVGGTAGYGGDGWVTLGVNGRFTQKDIDSNRVRYYQTTSLDADTPDSFTFTLRDSAFGYDVWTDPENPVAGREGGLRESPTGAIATQSFLFNIRAQPGANQDGFGPREASPGNGGSGMTYSFAPGSMTNGNAAVLWNEANVGAAGGGQVLTDGMLKYTITRTSTLPGGGTESVLIPASETVYTLTSQAPNGTLQRFAGGQWSTIALYGQYTQADIEAGTIRFVHDGSENHTASFGYRVSDGTTNFLDGSFALNITPVNDRPTVSGGRATVTEGAGNTVRLSFGSSDADLSTDVAKRSGEGAADVLWFRLASLPAAGTVQRWDGSAWVDISAADVTAGLWMPTALLAATADGGTSGLRYRHDGSEPLTYAGGVPEVQFTYVVRDDLAAPASVFDTSTAAVADNSGSAQSNASAAGTVTVSVIPVNEAPQIADRPGDADPVITATVTGGGALTGANEVLANVREGDTVTITNATLQAVDRDNTTIQRQFRLTALPTLGVLLRDGKQLGLGSTFTQKDIDDGLLKYRHGGSEVAAPTTDGLGTWNDKFNFIVSDGTQEDAGADSQRNVLLITLDPGNDAPTLTLPAGPVDIVKSGTEKTAITGITIGDVDLAVVVDGAEESFIRVELQVLDAANQAVASAQLDYTGTTPAASARSLVSGRNSNTLVLQGTLAQVQAALGTLELGFTADENSSTHKLRVTVDDRLRDNSGALTSGANGGIGATVNADGSSISDPNNRVSRDLALQVSTANNAPVIANASAWSINEDALLMLNGFTLTDLDSFNKNVTVEVRLYQDAARTIVATSSQGRLTYSGLSNVTATGNGSDKVTLVGTLSNVLTALNTLKFDNATDYNGAGVGTGELYLRTTVTDFGHADAPLGLLATVDNTISIVPVNDAPVLTVPASTQIMNSGTFIDISSGFNVQDTKDTSNGATDYVEVTLSARRSGALYGQLLIQTTTDVTVDNNASSSLVVKGTATAVTTALNSLRYTPDDPNVDSTIVVSVAANDLENGKETGGVGGNNTASGIVNIQISGSNDAPVLSVPGTLSVAEDSSNNTVAGVSYTDSDDFGGIQRVSVTVTHGTLDFGTKTGLTVVSGAYSSATVTVSGTKASLNTALATLRYTPTANYHGNDTLTISADDRGLVGSGGIQTDTETVAITVSPVNDRPTASNNVTLAAVAEDVAAADNPGVRFDTLSFGYSDATDNQGASGGGDTATANSFFAVVTNAATAAQGTWQVSDGAGGWITVPASGLSLSSALVFPPDRLLRFVPAADYFGTPGSLSVRLADSSVALVASSTAADRHNLNDTPQGDADLATGAWNSVNRTIGTSITGVNDAPQRTAASVAALAVAEDEAAPAGQTVSSLFSGVFSDTRDASQATAFAGVAVTAQVLDKGVWEYNSGGGWQALPGDIATDNSFVLAASTQLRFRSTTASFNGSPADALTVRLIDSSQAAAARPDLTGALSGGTTQYSDAANAVSIGASVAARNDAPTLTADSNPSATEVAGVTGSGEAINVALLANATPADLDLASTAALSSSVFGAGTVRVTLTDPLAADRLSASVLTGVASSSYSTATGILTVTLQSSITLAEVQAVLEGIRFTHLSDDPTALASGVPRATRAFSVELSDGNNVQSGGNAGGPAALATTLAGTLTLTPVNDPPVATNDGNSINEDDGHVDGNLRSNGATDTDPDTPFAQLVVQQILATGGTNQAVAAGSTSLLNGTTLSGKYGSLVVGADGSYRYSLDNDNATVNGLATGASLTDETFVYTLSDGALTTTATLTITILGRTDGLPFIQANDGNAGATGQGTVTEAALLSADDNGDIFNGTISVAALDGIKEVEVAGQVVTRAQLAALGTIPRTINSARGQLVLLGYDSSSAVGDITTGGTLQYRYTLSAAQSHAAGAVVDSFALTLRDQNGVAGTDTLTILIEDDSPSASDDINSFFKQSGTVSGSVAGNDRIGADGAAAAAGAVTIKTNEPGTYGSITLAANGSYTYTVDAANPAVAALAAPATLVDVISYTITDSDGDASNATLSITIRSNTAPTANNDTRSTAEDTAITGNVLTGAATGDVADSDADGNALTLTGFRVLGADYAAGATATLPGAGSISLASNGAYSFTPVADWNGSVPVIQYTINDGTGLSNASSTAQLSITVTPVADIANDSVSTLVNTAVTSTVLGNDSFEGTPTVSATTQGSKGSTSINGSNQVVYTPQAGFTGTDSYTYTVTSGGVTETATVTVEVRNTAPVAQADSQSTAEDSSTSGNVLANDSDADGQPLRVTAVTAGGSTVTIAAGSPASVTLAGQGQLILTSDGAWTFTPVADWHGAVAPISYTVSDGTGASNSTASATLGITVSAIADIVADSANTLVNLPVTTAVLANDSFEGAAQVVTVTAGSNGSTVRNAGNTITYTPLPGFIGSDSYTYTVSSGGVTETATVTVDVGNSRPQVQPETEITTEDNSISGNVLANDSDADGQPMRVTAVSAGGSTVAIAAGSPASVTLAGQGQLTLASDGAWSFTPLADWHGAVAPISYTVSDGTGASNSTASATLGITVSAIADIVADVIETRVNQPVTAAVLANDSFEGAAQVVAVTPGSKGNTTANADNTITYTPQPGFVGSDSYVYTVSSGGVTETVTVTVEVRNTAPVAQADSQSMAEDSSASGNVLANDSDADGQPLRVTAVSAGGSTVDIAADSPASVTLAGQGQLTLASDGAWSFTPLADWHGTVAPISYTVSDGTGASNGMASAVLDLVVTPESDIRDDSASTAAGVPLRIAVLDNDSFEGAAVVTAVTPGSAGSTSIAADNSILYTPAPGFDGRDSFAYTVASGGVTETATVAVEVLASFVAPVVSAAVDLPGRPQVASFSTGPLGAARLSPVTMDVDVFAGGWRPDSVALLPLPANSAVFINREIAMAQGEARRTESRMFSHPEFVMSGELASRSLGSNLGMDGAQYVLGEVRQAQQQALFQDLLVVGRLGRIQLSSDRMLGTPDLFQPLGALLQENAPPAGGPATEGVTDAPLPQEAGPPPVPADAADTPAAPAADPLAAVLHNRAQSFHQQILHTAARRPLGLRSIAAVR